MLSVLSSAKGLISKIEKDNQIHWKIGKTKSHFFGEEGLKKKEHIPMVNENQKST
jgi:hypothetical protein